MALIDQQLGARGDIALGDAFQITFAIRKNGAAYSPTVTGAKALFKLNTSDADSAAVITKTLGSGITVVGPLLTISIAAADQTTLTTTTTLNWSVRILEASGDEPTIAEGSLTLALMPTRTGP